MSRTRGPGSLHYTLFIDLTLGELLQMLDERRGAMCKSGICNTKPAISLKRSSLEPKLLQSVYRNSCMSYRLVTKSGDLGCTLAYFSGEQNFATRDISHFLSARDEIWQRWALANRNLLPEFRELSSVCLSVCHTSEPCKNG